MLTLSSVYCGAQVTLSQVFASMQQAQEQQLFAITDWSVANAKLEEVCLRAVLAQHALMFTHDDLRLSVRYCCTPQEMCWYDYSWFLYSSYSP